MPAPINISAFTKQFTEQLPFTANSDQEEAIAKLAAFINNQNNTDLFILRGYAGTGKTNLVSALSQILPTFKWKSVLLAPTGRAAKVLSLYSKRPAQTIHKKIFQNAFNPTLRITTDMQVLPPNDDSWRNVRLKIREHSSVFK